MDPILLLLVVIVGLLVNSPLPCYGKTFSRCELVHALERQHFPGGQTMRNWVCLVESESGRNTAAVGGPNPDGSYDYGLFQINNRYWCSKSGAPGGECHVRCRDLISDDITEASNCAKQIFRVRGFRSWYGWLKKCDNKPLPDISRCATPPSDNITTIINNVEEVGQEEEEEDKYYNVIMA